MKLQMIESKGRVRYVLAEEIKNEGVVRTVQDFSALKAASILEHGLAGLPPGLGSAR